jgi:heme ABC exporter ATP-binding subunit CcmA
MIRVEDLTKRFNNLIALDRVTLHIKKGESFALLGPNGAGKTTLVRVISTLLKPTAGRVYLNSIDIAEEPEDAKRQIGVVSHNPFLYDELTAVENLEFFANLYDTLIDPGALLEQVALAKRGRDQVGTFSRGMKQRLSIARAILHNPPILILDEPTSGLDLTSRKSFYSLVKTLKKDGKTILLTTHYLEEARELCSKGVVLDRGNIVTDVDLKSPKEELEEIFSGLEK